MSEKNIYDEEIDSLVAEISASVDETFSSMFGVKPSAQSHLLLPNPEAGTGVTGVVALTQDKFEGSFLLSFPRATIFAMLSKIYDKEFDQIDSSVREGVGELTNIIFGLIKANLNKRGYRIKMAIPAVVIGDQHTIVTSQDSRALIVPFKTPAGTFSALLSFRSEIAKSA